MRNAGMATRLREAQLEHLLALLDGAPARENGTRDLSGIEALKLGPDLRAFIKDGEDAGSAVRRSKSRSVGTLSRPYP